MTRLALLVAAALVLPHGGVQAASESAGTGPYEDLLEVLAVHAWHLDDDLYRRPAPTDASGRNVFVVTLERLDGWQKRFPTRLADVVDYARGQALERLGSWEEATQAFGRVATTTGSPLADAASAARDRAARFRAADALPEDGATLQDVIDALDEKLDAWQAAAEGADPVHDRLARSEIERLEVRAATLLVRHRHALKDGAATAERALRALIERHPDSKLLPRHVLRLADFYAAEAEDYADLTDRPLDFDAKTFDRLVDRALDAYQKLASWDGIPEKPIASGRFDAMTSLRDATREARE